MILKSLRLRGFKGVRAGMGVDEIFIDLATLPEGLIAITGPNGMGKTTVMDNLTPFRLMPFKIRKSPVWSPGAFSFYDQTFGPDACKELVFEMGGIDYRSLILIDADRRRQECYLYRSESDQWVPVNDGKSRTYDEAIEKVCGSPQLFFTSVYRCQSARNLSDYTRSDIMGIISELLNIDHIRLQGDKCRAVVAGLSAGLDLTRDRMVALSVEVEAVDGLSVSIADKISVLDVERTNLVVARASLDVTRSTVATLREQQAAQESEAARLLLLKTQLSDEEKRLADGLVAAEKAAADIDHRIALVVTERDRVAADLQTRIDRATRIVSGAEAIRKAVADEAQTQAALAGYKSRLPDIQTTRDVAFAHSTDIGQRIVGTCSTRDAALADLRTRIARSNGIMADAVGIRQAVEQEANAVAILDNERGRLQSVQATRDARFQCVATQQMNLVRVKARLDAAKNDSDKLVGLDCRHDESGWLNPTCRFISEAVAGREALPELIAEHAALVEDCTANIALADADLALQDCRARIAAAEAELVACQPLARMLPELDLAVANLDTWNQEVADITARVGLELTNLYAEQALAQAALADADLALKECRRWVEVG